ncbi:MAG: serine hydroxymethyltransferase, partial [Roseibium sp.]|nr:serine hydroxymethyltransferase [Roseibium sp.]
DGDMNGLRFGTPELVRWGLTAEDMPRLAELIAEALRSNDPTTLAGRVAEWRRSFDTLHFVHG